MARSATAAFSSSTTATETVTVQGRSPSSASSSRPPETVVLRLSRPKKKVTWKEGTVDNEFLGRKSSKQCCIFHKQKPFDEDESDDEVGSGGDGVDNGGGARSEGCCSSHGRGVTDAGCGGSAVA